MSVSKKLRAGFALSAVLLSCQLVACGSDTVDYGSGGTTSSGGKAGTGQGGKAGSAHAGSGHAGEVEAEAGAGGEVEMGGGSGGLGMSGGGAGGAAHGGTGGGAGGGGAGAGSGGKGGAAGSGGVGGGSSAGSGGKAGAGGASAGTGGSIAGAGGNSGDSGGAAAGSGGTSAGSGGGSSLTCGNGTVDTGEVCDPKFTVNNCGSDCKAISSTTCIACESNPSACPANLLTCDTATGNATEGPAVGIAKNNLCNETLDCIRDSGCAYDATAGEAKPILKFCYCGTANTTDCNNGLANGPCKAAFERSFETTSFQAVSQRVGTLSYGGGVAFNRIVCDQNFCIDRCF